MSRLKIPPPVKPVAAIFTSDPGLLAEAGRRLEAEVGVLDYISREFLFDQTDYYREEMGWPLKKRYLAAERLMDPTSLVALKIRAMAIEAEFLDGGGRRRVNIDPGYLSAERLVLATGKNYIHRIYLGQGVWADLTLIFEAGEFKTLPWTYPDYATEEVRSVMKDIRLKYLDQLKARREEAE